MVDGGRHGSHFLKARSWKSRMFIAIFLPIIFFNICFPTSFELDYFQHNLLDDSKEIISRYLNGCAKQEPLYLDMTWLLGQDSPLHGKEISYDGTQVNHAN